MKKTHFFAILCLLAAFVCLSACEAGNDRPSSAGDTVPASSDARNESSAITDEQSTWTQSKETKPDDSDKPTVYFTSDISPEGLVKIYNALHFTPSGKVAVKNA